MAKVQKSIELPEVEFLAADDEFIVNAFVQAEGKTRTARIKSTKLTGGLVTIEASTTAVTEADHLSRFLAIDNNTGAVELVVPDASEFGAFGLIFGGRIQSGANPVSIRCAVGGQLRAARQHTGSAFTADTIFLGPSTANSDEVVFRVYLSFGIWTIDCPFGVRLAATDDNTLVTSGPAGSTPIEVRDQANAVITGTLSRLDVNGAATVVLAAPGHVELTVTADGPSESTLAFANPITWDLTTDPTTQLTLTGNTTINGASLLNGATYKITLTQDATGGRLVTWGTLFVDQPEIETAPNAITLLVFEAHAGNLYSPGNVGDPQTLGGLNLLSVIDGAADRLLIERDSDNAAFATTPSLLFSAIVAPINQTTNARTLADADHNSLIRCTAASTQVEVTDELSQGFVCTLINRSSNNLTIITDGVVTLVGNTVLSPNHIAAILVDANGVLCRVTG